MSNTYYVYILKCSDDSYYTGVSNDYVRRLEEHELGKHRKAYTFSRRPVTLVYLEEFYDVYQAISWEKQIKGWSRKKKEAIIRDNWSALAELSICNNESSHKNYKER